MRTNQLFEILKKHLSIKVVKGKRKNDGYGGVSQKVFVELLLLNPITKENEVISKDGFWI